ncbi:MAG: hypothetical protein IPO88_14160 [Nannocystis sp.]|uniref:hypothetical protein n=2 Tax=Nannocystis sp. TaxID=1962667 RepID=UPI0024234D04|nr:hypothetical protein [Nannocystis sp.]MBK9754622.1 hypothetical protein [Nannocystis sp.]
MASHPRMSRHLHPLALVLLVACASTRAKACHDGDDTTTQTTTAATAATTSPSTGAATAGEIDDTDVVAVDRALQALLGGIYREARRSSWKRESGPGSIVFTLEYSLGQAHSKASVAALSAGMTSHGFTVDRVLDDDAVTTVFAARDGFPVSVTVDVGASTLVATVERAGP